MTPSEWRECCEACEKVCDERAKIVLQHGINQPLGSFAMERAQEAYIELCNMARLIRDLGERGPEVPSPCARPLAEWHEDIGAVTWWIYPINEPAWIGMPTDSDWPGYHTHWTPHPPLPEGESDV